MTNRLTEPKITSLAGPAGSVIFTDVFDRINSVAVLSDAAIS